MTTPHRATWEQWASVEGWCSDHDACLLELRDRIAALEANANLSAGLTGSPVPARGLVERVARAIHPSVCADPNLYLHEARAAILEVAAWLEFQEVGCGLAAGRWLRAEVERD